MSCTHTLSHTHTRASPLLPPETLVSDMGNSLQDEEIGLKPRLQLCGGKIGQGKRLVAVGGKSDAPANVSSCEMLVGVGGSFDAPANAVSGGRARGCWAVQVPVYFTCGNRRVMDGTNTR